MALSPPSQVVSIWYLGVARAIRAHLVKRVLLGPVALGVVVVFDVRARIVAAREPVPGRAWGVVPAPDVQNTEAGTGKLVAGIEKLRRADAHSKSHRSRLAFGPG